MKPAARPPREVRVIVPFQPSRQKRSTRTAKSDARSPGSWSGRSFADKCQVLALEAPEVARRIERIVEGALTELGLTHCGASK